VSARRAATAALLALAAVLALALLAGCGAGTSTVIFKDKTDDSTTSAVEPEGGGESVEAEAELPPQVPSELAIETGSPGFDAAAIYREDSPGVVTIRSVFGAAGGAEGSGFVLDADGEIVTNAHVVTEESSEGSEARTEAKEVFIEFSNRNVLEAKILGFDPFADVALLKVEPEGFPLHPLEPGDDAELEVGEPVAAIGSPFGEERSLSVGVVSATDREVSSLTQFKIEGAIQTDASINPGNSGGPLLEEQGKVIGINQQIETNSGANDGVGFAVPMTAIERSVAMLRESGTVEYAYIGVTSQSLYPQLAQKLGIDSPFGALVAEVVEGGPAAEAGLKGGDNEIVFQAQPYKVGGDVIVDVEGRKVVQPDALVEAVAAKKPGEKLELTVLRDNKRKTIDVTLGKRPNQVE
jgi:S1-C subfamily serine protease